LITLTGKEKGNREKNEFHRHDRGPLKSDFTREPTASRPSVSKCPPIACTAVTPSLGSVARLWDLLVNAR